jgi:hypothetical protein
VATLGSSLLTDAELIETANRIYATPESLRDFNAEIVAQSGPTADASDQGRRSAPRSGTRTSPTRTPA